MASAKRVCSILGAMFAYTLFAISWLSWIIMLGGVAGMQAKCGGYLGHEVNVKIGSQDLKGFTEGCDTTNTTAFIWWTVWFEFFLLVLLSVAECGRVHGLYLTKQIFIAMVSVCLMLAADRSNIVISTYDGALQSSAQACMAGQVITIICNLILLLYFGGEVQDMRRASPEDSYGGKQPMSSDVNLQMSGSVPSMVGISSGPTFRIAEPPLSENPFAQPMGRGNQYSIEFERLYQSGSSTIPSVAVPETKKERKAAVATAVALGGDSWQA